MSAECSQTPRVSVCYIYVISITLRSLCIWTYSSTPDCLNGVGDAATRYDISIRTYKIVFNCAKLQEERNTDRSIRYKVHSKGDISHGNCQFVRLPYSIASRYREIYLLQILSIIVIQTNAKNYTKLLLTKIANAFGIPSSSPTADKPLSDPSYTSARTPRPASAQAATNRQRSLSKKNNEKSRSSSPTKPALGTNQSARRSASRQGAGARSARLQPQSQLAPARGRYSAASPPLRRAPRTAPYTTPSQAACGHTQQRGASTPVASCTPPREPRRSGRAPAPPISSSTESTVSAARELFSRKAQGALVPLTSLGPELAQARPAPGTFAGPRSPPAARR